MNQKKPIDTNDINSDLDIRLIFELHEQGYIKGIIDKLLDGSRNRIFDITPTLKGRLFQSNLEKQLEDRTFTGKINKHAAIIIGVILGFGCNIILENCEKHIFQLKNITIYPD